MRLAPLRFAGRPEIGAPEERFTEARPTEIGLHKTGSGRVRQAEVGIAQIGRAEACLSEVCPAQVRSAQSRSREIGSAEICLTEIGAAEAGTIERGITEVTPAEARLKFAPSRFIPLMRRFRFDNASESNRRSQAYDQRIGDRLPRGRGRRRRYVTAGTEDQLQIRLQNPPWCNVCFVGDFEHRLVITDRALDAGELNLVLV